jgi:hypothetical protein
VRALFRLLHIIVEMLSFVKTIVALTYASAGTAYLITQNVSFFSKYGHARSAHISVHEVMRMIVMMTVIELRIWILHLSRKGVLLPSAIPLTWCDCRRFFRWRWGGGIFKEAHYYFNHGQVECMSSEPLDPNKKYIIGWHPHGRLFLGIGCFISNQFEWCGPKYAASGKHVSVGIQDTMYEETRLISQSCMLSRIGTDIGCTEKCSV